jgi:hypothetical protein
VRKLGLRLKQFALLIAVNPFVLGCGNRGGKPDNFMQSHKLRTQQKAQQINNLLRFCASKTAAN